MELPKTKSRFSEKQHALLVDLIGVLNALETVTKEPSHFPSTQDPVDFYNSYIDFAVALYSAKCRQLYHAVATSLENESYFIYASAGRAIVENAATLRYYSRHSDLQALRTAWRTSEMCDALLRTATNTLDRFVRGNRFSWDAFIEGRFDDLTGKSSDEALSQISVLTCLENWYREKPQVRSLYALLCDLVHPNVGSNLLALRVAQGRLLAAGEEGEYACGFVVVPTLCWRGRSVQGNPGLRTSTRVSTSTTNGRLTGICSRRRLVRS